jgi:signal transduction histidine kinase
MEQDLEIRLTYEQALTYCANTLLTGGDTEGVIQATITYLIDAVETSRVFVAENLDIDSLGQCIRLRNQICAPGIPEIPKQAVILQQRNLGAWLNQLWSAKCVIGQIDEVGEVERKLMTGLGFVSILLLPIGEPGNWEGIIGFGEAQEKRTWEKEDIQLLQTVAYMLYAYQRRRKNALILAQARDEALQASQFKSELLAKVSHELRTPLSAILGYAQLLSFGSYGEINEEQNEATGMIVSSTKYLASLVNGLLDQAQIESGQLTLQYLPFDVSSMVNEVEARTRILAEHKGLEFQTMIDRSTPEMYTGDRMRLEQVLTNLLGNAIKFTETGRIRLWLGVEGDDFRMEITDTGPGIPDEEKNRIFESFAQVDGSPTRRFSGTGLGLSISRQLVEMMGGKILLESELGVGSTFVVALPLGENKQIKNQPHKTETQNPLPEKSYISSVKLAKSGILI